MHNAVQFFLILLQQGFGSGQAMMLRASPSVTKPALPSIFNDTKSQLQLSERPKASTTRCSQEAQDKFNLRSVHSELHKDSEFKANQRCFDLLDLPFDTDLGALVETGDDSNRFSFNLGNQQSKRNVGKINRDKPMLWLHIHKAGGTFMCEMAQLAGEHVVRPNENCNLVDRDGYHQSGRPEYSISCQERVELFSREHFSWGAIERELFASDHCWDDFKFGTLLRDPGALILSFLNAEHDVNGEFFASLKLALDSPTPAGPHQWPNWKMYDNFQTRLLSSSFDVPAGRINQTHLDAAKQLLDDHFDVVACLEDLPRLRSTFFSSLGWRPEMASHIGDMSNSCPHDLKFTDEELALLKQLNKYDIQLYNSYALSRTDAQSSSHHRCDPHSAAEHHGHHHQY